MKAENVVELVSICLRRRLLLSKLNGPGADPCAIIHESVLSSYNKLALFCGVIEDVLPRSISIPEYISDTPGPTSPVFSDIMLSSMVKLVVLILKVSPSTTRLPVTLTDPPLATGPVSSVILAPSPARML